jgi:aminopeptidase-like protein
VLNYSEPFSGRLRLAELKEHLHSLPDHPEWVPYRTSYYARNWGFCLSHRQLLALDEGEYDVCVASSLEPGSLTYGEYAIPGRTTDEILVSCHVCHPSLANDNLSGIAVAAFLAKLLADRYASAPPRLTYRFLFIPGTIGSITWLARNEATVSRVKHGLVLTCVGDDSPPTYKKTRRGDAPVDRAMLHVLRHAGEHRVLDFYPYGYDERQYSSPGFDLAVGAFMRSQHGTFPEYHTSADDLGFVRPQRLAESLQLCLSALDVLEHDRRYVNLSPKGEPQLGRRGIYKAISGQQGIGVDQTALLWVLNLSDGEHSLLDIAERAGVRFEAIRRAAELLREHELLREVA